MKIGMSHGAGGEVMGNLISQTILNNLSKKSVEGGYGLDALDDGATIPLGDYEIVVTTDGHTVNPLFFPGGDIGRISAAGTINDVSVMGAKPLAISNAMILQEGFPIEDLEKIIKSLSDTCEEADVAVITGDTKVMEQDKLDGIVIVTTGIGIESDVAPMWGIISKALEVGGVTAMKDPTRGGLANCINEMARKSGVGVMLQDDAIPVKEAVRAASDMLGIDPYEVANEGKVLMGVKAEKAEEILAAIKTDKYGKDAAIIGEVIDDDKVLIETGIGGVRILETPIADPVPRVC